MPLWDADTHGDQALLPVQHLQGLTEGSSPRQRAAQAQTGQKQRAAERGQRGVTAELLSTHSPPSVLKLHGTEKRDITSYEGSSHRLQKVPAYLHPPLDTAKVTFHRGCSTFNTATPLCVSNWRDWES